MASPNGEEDLILGGVDEPADASRPWCSAASVFLLPLTAVCKSPCLHPTYTTLAQQMLLRKNHMHRIFPSEDFQRLKSFCIQLRDSRCGALDLTRQSVKESQSPAHPDAKWSDHLFLASHASKTSHEPLLIWGGECSTSNCSCDFQSGKRQR